MVIVDIPNGMSQFNPFVGAIAQTPQAQRLASADRAAQMRKTAENQKTTGYSDQSVDEFVESADAIASVGEDAHQQDPRRKKRREPDNEAVDPDTEAPHIDVCG